MLAIGFVVIDLGQPLRLWELFVYSNLGSPLMWDIIVLGTYLILSIVYLWAMLRFEGGKGSAAALRVVSAIALVCAVLVHLSLIHISNRFHAVINGPVKNAAITVNTPCLLYTSRCV